ncbi:YaaA family protein [Puniceibacterium sp. IMCC21224]|uniref:YaaA family protein n=1 Tax=Puniceibacterium sp. IMCC21224 TaxID=1618204 RepID=UPI00064D934B|nr:YaaA family protein [Puniceibacterium sp. IMCC21224]KMK65499.1 hypothetical protein IMCC21224_11330 [Puniceibacterium sp. IMCC21224]
MLILLSPAKRLNETRALGRATTTPRFIEEAEEIVSVARNWSPEQISDLMKVSPGIAQLNVDRFASWSRESMSGQAAGNIFDGDVYRFLEIETLDEVARTEATRRLRILSGLYGLLRPTDDVCAYRLEMGRKLPGHEKANLYQFWGKKIAQAIVQDARDLKSDILLNLASDEYAKSVDRSALDGLTVIDPRFEEDRQGTRKVISVSAKRARGAMARWVLEFGISAPSELKTFDMGGYVFDPEASSLERPVFVRA